VYFASTRFAFCPTVSVVERFSEEISSHFFEQEDADNRHSNTTTPIRFMEEFLRCAVNNAASWPGKSSVIRA